ncbi:MAG: hypothetical protein P1P76_06330 [Anaerolineales bacterium]|nr:hypothetical protein [Anaerolineales bacterium]
MRIEELDEFVDELVLRRGEDYHHEGRVLSLERTGEDTWRAVVEGTERYEVHIECDADGEFAGGCSCPYDWGPVCKHVIAVLFAIEELDPEAIHGDAIQTPDAKSEQVRAILEQLPREKLLDMLVELAENDRAISLEIRARYGERGPDKAAYVRMAREALRMGENRRGFIDYWGVTRAFEGLNALLSRAHDLLRAGQPEASVSIAQAVLETTAQAYENADDSIGLLGDGIDSALRLLGEAGSQLPQELRSELFEYCLDQAPLEAFCSFGWQWDLTGLAADLIASPEERDWLFGLLDEMAGPSPEPYSYGADHNHECAAWIKLSVIEREDGEEAALRFIQEHSHLHAFRQRLIEYHLEQGELAEVKRLCVEWLETQPHDWRGVRRYYLDTLLEVAIQEDDSPEVLRLARTLLLESGKLKYYLLIKETVPEQDWPGTLDSLIADLKASSRGWSTLPEIYAREGMWEALLELALESGELTLARYREALEPRFPEQISRAYEEIVYRMLERTSDRGTYAEAAGYLRRMIAMGYGEQVNKIIDDLIGTYRRRRAMIEELEAVRPE